LRLNVDYVQDLLEEDGQRVAQLLLEQASGLHPPDPSLGPLPES